MPPAGQLKPPVPARLSDRVAIGALTATFPPELVDRVLAQTGRTERRQRLLPARMVVYQLLALALFADVAYLEVLRLLAEALRRPPGAAGPPWRRDCRSSPRWCRRAPGWVPSRCVPCSRRPPGRWPRPTPRGRGIGTGGDRWGHVGRGPTPAPTMRHWPGEKRRREGTGAFPQVRVVGLVECAPTPPWARCWGPTGRAEVTLAGRLLGGLEEGPGGGAAAGRPVVLGAELWRTAAATGAELLWRAKTGKTAPKLPVDRVLADGPWLSRLYAAGDRRKRHPIVVRVLEYRLDDPGRPQAPGRSTGW